ncbi:MAG: hypothetical protein H6724_11780 [Sandaracinus sp.]|nr:hypothetical protein [Sandaracinus sp.]MCB9620113.1 hypothetical protein [Sandaracinus sp.]MCB9622515.1 hypothetical protein [Sandaracinus sp.]
MRITAWLLLVVACGGAESPSTSSTEDEGESSGAMTEPTTHTPEPTPTTPTEPAFVHGGLRCMHVTPEGELASCEEISEAGNDAPSAEENCAMLGARLEPGACPTAERVGRCHAMDGPELRPVYPIRISYYRSTLVADAARAMRICADLDGTFVPEP